MCVWVIGVGVGGGIGRINVACRDPVQPRFGHISSCKPVSSYLSVPEVRKKCYKIPPENDLCLCEDIFQQYQAKLVNCDMEDANAVESYKEPNFDFNENVCNSDCIEIINNECCCGGSDSVSSKSSSVDDERKIDEIETPLSSKSSLLPSPNLALDMVTGSNSRSRQLSEKLTAEERNQVLRELDDIMTGRFLTKVRRFSQEGQSSSDSGGNVDGHHRRSGFPMQQFDEGRSQLAPVAASRLRVKRSSSLDTEEMVNYGKVAELTRRFSRLGEASIITPQRYRSEPNFFHKPFPSVDDRYGYDNEDLSSDGGGHVGDTSNGDDYNVVQQPIQVVFIRPMSYSDDRLDNRGFLPSSGRGGGVVLTEVTSDGENDERRAALNATQTRRRSFRKSVAFDSSLSSVDGDCGVVDESDAINRYLRLKGGCPLNTTATNNNFCSKSSEAVSVSNVGRSHRRYSSVDVYDQSEVDIVTAETEAEEEEESDAATVTTTETTFLDVEKTEKEFRDGLVAEQNRRHEAIRDYLANKELLLIKMKSASVGGILRWNQEHQDTLLDDEELLQSHQPTSSSAPDRVDKSSSDEGSPKEGMRRVLRAGLKGRRIRRLRKLESRCSGFALADLWRVSKDEPRQHSTAGGYSSTEPPDNHNNTL